MTLVIADAATVRTSALVLLLIAGGVSGLFLLYNSLYRHPQQRRALGTVRLRLPIVSSASARQRTPWKKFLFVGIGLILGVLVFLLNKCTLGDYTARASRSWKSVDNLRCLGP